METDKRNLNAVLYALGELEAYKTLSNSERNVAIEAMDNLNSNGIDLGFVFTDVKNNDIILPKTDIKLLIREVFEKLEEYEDSDSDSGSNSSKKSSSKKMKKQKKKMQRKKKKKMKKKMQRKKKKNYTHPHYQNKQIQMKTIRKMKIECQKSILKISQFMCVLMEKMH